MLNAASEDLKNATESSKKKYRTPAAEILPSERFPFPTHLGVLKRFSTLSYGGKQALDAARVEGGEVPTQAAQLNVRFMKAIGLLKTTDRGQYLPTEETVRFVAARSVSDEKARPLLAALLERTWIVSTARSILTPTKATTDQVLCGELAIAAQTDMEKKKNALRVLVDYLLFSGIIRREDDGLVLVSAKGGDLLNKSLPANIDTPSVNGESEPPLNQTGPGWHTIQTEDFVLRIRSNTDAVDDLAEHLKTLRRKIERLMINQTKIRDDSEQTSPTQQ